MSQPNDSEVTNPTAVLVDALVARMFCKVEAFNKTVIGMPVPETPQVLKDERLLFARKCFCEEDVEFDKATEAQDVLEAADALIDGIYFRLGRLVEMGVPALAVFEGVHQANMGKERGELSKRPGAMGYDAVKPVGWKAPDHSYLLNFSLADVQKASLFNEMSPVFQKITYLRAAKGDDYNNVPGGRDAYFPYGHLSYGHMLNTKALRIQSLLTAMQDGKAPNYEGLLDSVMDLVNYGAFYAEALMAGKLTLVQPSAAERHFARLKEVTA